MKKPYQIESQQAVKRLERMDAEGNLDVQLVLPMAETLSWLRKRVGELGLLPVQVLKESK
jgi:hypothetical protein